MLFLNIFSQARETVDRLGKGGLVKLGWDQLYICAHHGHLGRVEPFDGER